ncbi:hypothetical protein Scep_011916 [Stephania cephalantha]|uniref:Alpha/beta hydrolase fold-3 domain-containing protein n=1 Tax=Stephania cephalantha TaxID=152367 RepID=A0AAP0JE86_9MAGN
MVHEKKLVDQVSGWLSLFDDGSVNRAWTGPPEVEFMVKRVEPHDEYIDGVAVYDLIIDSKSDLIVRVYEPKGILNDDESKLPIVLHFHGGGFCISQYDWAMYYHVYTRLASTIRAIVVSVKLRLAPEHRLPAAIEDAYSALLWIRSLAQVLESVKPSHELARADFNRVFLIGDSSGGNLVHAVAARAGEEDLSPLRLAGAIPVHPGFVRSVRSESEKHKEFETPFLSLDMVDKFLALALPRGSTKDHPITCPMGEAAPPLSRMKLPPYMLAVAENDLIKDTEMEFFEAMKKAGKDIEVFFNKGVGHSFYLNKLAVDFDERTAKETDLLFEAIANFINKH